MNSFSFPLPRTFTVLVVAILLTGCAHEAQPLPELTLEHNPTYVEGLIAETRTESHQLRALLANERITNAKQRADVRSAQKALSHLREEQITWHEKVENAEAQVSSLSNERDSLYRQVTELNGKISALPHLLDLVQETRIIHSTVKEITSSIQMLAANIKTVQHDFRRYQTVLKTPRPAQSRSSLRTIAERRFLADDGTITVHHGDSLWVLARTYGTSVKALRKLNHIKSDLIYPGQHLHLWPSMEKGIGHTSTVTASTAPTDTSIQP